jgi:5'-3' exonuclease
MGIKNLFNMIKEHAPGAIRVVDPDVLLKSSVAFDFNYAIHRLSKSRAVCNQAAINGFHFGAPQHVEAVAEQMAAMSAMFRKSLWLVDNPVTTEAKRFEKLRRQQASKRSAELRDARVGAFKKLCIDVGPQDSHDMATVSLQDLGALGEEMSTAVAAGQLTLKQVIDSRKQHLERQEFQSGHIGGDMLRDVRNALCRRGIDSAMAPVGVEAEQLAATLQQRGLFDFVATDDTDTLVFGATELLCKFDGMTFQCVSLTGVLEGMQMSMPEFVDFCILSGCDFTERTLKAIGPKTAFKLIKEHHSIEMVLLARGLDATGFDYSEARHQFTLDVNYEFLDTWWLNMVSNAIQWVGEPDEVNDCTYAGDSCLVLMES